MPGNGRGQPQRSHSVAPTRSVSIHKSASRSESVNQKTILGNSSPDYCGQDYKVASNRHNQKVELAWRCQGFLWRKETKHRNEECAGIHSPPAAAGAFHSPPACLETGVLCCRPGCPSTACNPPQEQSTTHLAHCLLTF